MDAPITHSVPGAVEAIGKTISRSTMYKDIASGKLVARKLGRRTIILHDDLVAYLRSLPRMTTGEAA